MILLIDNYDSFLFNIVHYLQELGADVRVERNDALSVAQAMKLNPTGVVLSPGPCTPDEAGISLGLVDACAASHIPLLGICLGHQAIAQHFGANVVRGGLRHGKISAIRHDGSGVFSALPSPFKATRYHSLSVESASLPAELVVNAHTDDGVIMGLRHRDLSIHGVQFHPESIATEQGHALLANFLDMVHRPAEGIAA